VSAHRSALEGVALDLRRPMQWRRRSPRGKGLATPPPGARVGAGGLPGRTHHWRLDISP